MNREQRRKLVKQGVTADDLKRIYEQTKATSIKYAVSAYSTALAIVLHDKYGFGEKRLKAVLAQVEDTFDSIVQGYVSLDDLKKTILEECKVNIK